MGVINIMGEEGDVKVEWNPDNSQEVETAKRVFEDNVTKGFMAFKTKKDGTKGKQIKDFDPEAEAILLVPPLVGG